MEFREVIFFLLATIESVCMQMIYFPELIDKNIFDREKVRVWFPVLTVALLYSYNGTGTIVSTGFLIVCPVITGALFFVFARKYTFWIMIWNYFIIASVFLFKLLVLILEGLYYQKNTIEMNYGNRTWGENFFEILLIAFLIVVIFLLRHKGISIKPVCRKFWLCFCIMSVIGYEMLSYILMDGWDGTEVKMLVLILCIIVAVLFFLFSVVLSFIIIQMKDDKNMLLVKQRTVESYYTELMERYRIIGRINHDVAQERAYLYRCIKGGETDKAEKYLEKQQKLENERKRIWTGNDYIDFVVNLQWEKMEKNAIQFRFQSEFTEFPLDDEEVCVVFGNLLDNAICAASKCDQRERWINVGILQHNDMCRVLIANSSTEYPVVMEGRFQTSKRDKILHGWGLQNVEAIVKKHNGTVKYKYTDQYFEVQIMFWNMQQEGRKENGN